jgi:sugar/nucleoside kinase (ribokinase family)
VLIMFEKYIKIKGESMKRGCAMSEIITDIIVAGHICLDMIPEFPASGGGLEETLVPGKLVGIGPALFSTGGAVSNTGLALHRLGLSVRLMGKVGKDLFGDTILSVLRSYGDGLERDMIVSPDEGTSYTVVISPPGVDRIFLHSTGTNDTFAAADVRMEAVAQSRLFHFGYPPLMRRMFADGGRELASMLEAVKRLGPTVTLDMARPDPDSPAGRTDWRELLKRTLPHVDVFFPSYEELYFMLDPEGFQRASAEYPGSDLIARATPELLEWMSSTLLDWGAASVVLKLGEHGLYIRTTSDESRWSRAGRCAPANRAAWTGREWQASVYKTEVAGTTGAGDCTIAGFLAGMAKGLTLEDTVSSALAVGAFNVEKADAVSGIPHWDTVQSRLERGWPVRQTKLELPGYLPHNRAGWLRGPRDAG